MQLNICRIILVAPFFYSATAAANTEEPVFDPPKGRLSIHSTAQEGQLYGAEKLSAGWHVSQWNNPTGDIADFRNGMAGNSSLTVREVSGEPIRFVIHQSGERLGCEKNRVPIEFDGFIGANTRANNPDSSSAERPIVQTPLAGLTSLTQKLTVKLDSIVTLRQTCEVTKAASIVCIVFSNKIAHQTFFLQVVVLGLGVGRQPFWWARGQKNGRYGYNLVADTAKTNWQPGQEKEISIDVLPNVMSLISSGSFGIDKNLDNWLISGAYFGNVVYGQIEIETEWSAYSLTAVPN